MRAQKRREEEEAAKLRREVRKPVPLFPWMSVCVAYLRVARLSFAKKPVVLNVKNTQTKRRLLQRLAEEKKRRAQDDRARQENINKRQRTRDEQQRDEEEARSRLAEQEAQVRKRGFGSLQKCVIILPRQARNKT